MMPETQKFSDATTQIAPVELDESTYLRESYSETAVDHPVENGLWWIFRCRNTLLVVPIFFVTTFRATTLSVLLQYTAVRYGWKLSSVRKSGVSTEQVPNANCLYIDKRLIVRGCRRQPAPRSLLPAWLDLITPIQVQNSVAKNRSISRPGQPIGPSYWVITHWSCSNGCPYDSL